jgi:hypothetical protein
MLWKKLIKIKQENENLKITRSKIIIKSEIIGILNV